MKRLIAAAILAVATTAQAQVFDYTQVEDVRTTGAGTDILYEQYVEPPVEGEVVKLRFEVYTDEIYSTVTLRIRTIQYPFSFTPGYWYIDMNIWKRAGEATVMVAQIQGPFCIGCNPTTRVAERTGRWRDTLDPVTLEGQSQLWHGLQLRRVGIKH